MSAVEVRGKLLRWAMDRSGIAASKLRAAFPRLDEWEQGEEHPTLRQLEDFARKTQTPLGYFFLPDPPDDRLPIQDFRTNRDAKERRPSPNLLETVQTMMFRQDWMRDFLEEQGASPLPFVGSVRLSDSPQHVANSIRKTLGLELEWARTYSTWTEALRALHQSADAAGVLVVVNGVVGNNTRRKLDPDEFQGFALTDERAPLIFVNGADFKAAQMFTLVHELAHLWVGRGGVSALEMMQPASNETELFCDAAAAEFLVPREALREVWPGVADRPEPFRDLARRFKVSSIVAARRAKDLGLLPKRDFLAFLEAWRKDERRLAKAKASGGDFFANQNGRVGRRFAQAVAIAAQNGRLLYGEAYRLTGLYGSTYDKFAKTLGLGKTT